MYFNFLKLDEVCLILIFLVIGAGKVDPIGTYFLYFSSLLSLGINKVFPNFIWFRWMAATLIDFYINVVALGVSQQTT